MSKIKNDGLTQSGAESFIAVPIWQQWASKHWSSWQSGIISQHLKVEKRFSWKSNTCNIDLLVVIKRRQSVTRHWRRRAETVYEEVHLRQDEATHKQIHCHF